MKERVSGSRPCSASSPDTAAASGRKLPSMRARTSSSLSGHLQTTARKLRGQSRFPVGEAFVFVQDAIDQHHKLIHLKWLFEELSAFFQDVLKRDGVIRVAAHENNLERGPHFEQFLRKPPTAEK